MKPKKETMQTILQAASKPILIKYILNRWAYDERTERELAWLKWEEMTSEAKEMMDDSIKKSKKFYECGNKVEWFEQQKRFDEAQELYDKADKFFKEKIARVA
jgi:hypothetical protein